MRYILLPIALFVMIAYQCGSPKNKTNGTQKDSTQVQDSVPACVRQMLDQAGKEIPPNLPIQVDEYTYKQKKVYLFTADCCDQYNNLYDENCKLICAPSGGLEGRGDRNCLDFDSLAKHVKRIWTKPESK